MIGGVTLFVTFIGFTNEDIKLDFCIEYYAQNNYFDVKFYLVENGKEVNKGYSITFEEININQPVYKKVRHWHLQRFWRFNIKGDVMAIVSINKEKDNYQFNPETKTFNYKVNEMKDKDLIIIINSVEHGFIALADDKSSHKVEDPWLLKSKCN